MSKNIKKQNKKGWFSPATRLCCGNHQHMRQLVWAFCPSFITTLLSVASFCKIQEVPLIEIPLPQLAASRCGWPSGVRPRCPDSRSCNQPNLTYAMELDRHNSEYNLLIQWGYISEDVISQTMELNRCYSELRIMPWDWTDTDVSLSCSGENLCSPVEQSLWMQSAKRTLPWNSTDMFG